MQAFEEKSILVDFFGDKTCITGYKEEKIREAFGK